MNKCKKNNTLFRWTFNTQTTSTLTRWQARQAVLEVTAAALCLPMPASYSAWFNWCPDHDLLGIQSMDPYSEKTLDEMLHVFHTVYSRIVWVVFCWGTLNNFVFASKYVGQIMLLWSWFVCMMLSLHSQLRKSQDIRSHLDHHKSNTSLHSTLPTANVGCRYQLSCQASMKVAMPLSWWWMVMAGDG